MLTRLKHVIPAQCLNYVKVKRFYSARVKWQEYGKPALLHSWRNERFYLASG